MEEAEVEEASRAEALLRSHPRRNMASGKGRGQETHKSVAIPNARYAGIYVSLVVVDK